MLIHVQAHNQELYSDLLITVLCHFTLSFFFVYTSSANIIILVIYVLIYVLNAVHWNLI